MAKKKRVRRKAKRAAPAATAQATTTPEPAASRGARRGASTEDLKEEYAYVVKDLRRVFFIAALMFGLLILLNVVLQ